MVRYEFMIVKLTHESITIKENKALEVSETLKLFC